MGAELAVVVVPARYEGAETRLQGALGTVGAAVVFCSGDEEARFVHEKVSHPAIRWWHQLPRPGVHDFARPFGCGSPPHLRPLLRDLGPHVERVHDWSVSMQVNHPRRAELVAVLEGMDGGYLNVTPGFTQGLPHDRYARLLASTKVVPCPGGRHTVDTFRVFEALEAGCIPVADGVTEGWDASGYWPYLFRETPPFPVATGDWQTFPGVLEELLDGFQEKANRVQAWWLGHRRTMACWLADDLAELSA